MKPIVLICFRILRISSGNILIITIHSIKNVATADRDRNVDNVIYLIYLILVTIDWLYSVSKRKKNLINLNLDFSGQFFLHADKFCNSTLILNNLYIYIYMRLSILYCKILNYFLISISDVLPNQKNYIGYVCVRFMLILNSF